MNKMESLVKTLNEACEAYYEFCIPIMSDRDFDIMYDELKKLEESTGIQLPESPTRNVGWHRVEKKINDVTLSHEMLSLNKCHDVKEVRDAFGDYECAVSIKLDGLSCTLTYEDGVLVSAATRGDGRVGSDVMSAALVIDTIPKKIRYKDRLIVDGEVIITKDTFREINNNLPPDKQFKTPRNLAAGTLTMLDNAIIKERNLKFVAWRVIEGFNFSEYNSTKLIKLTEFGFDIVPMQIIIPGESLEKLQEIIDMTRDSAELYGYPCDGVVIAVDSIAKAIEMGKTDKFPRHSLAYKFEDQLVETTLRDIEWNTSKNGVLTPVAIFDDVVIDGTTVNRSTLHNPDYIQDLQLGIGDKILIRKANQIIPRVEENVTRSGDYVLPRKCPSCGAKLEYRETETSHLLYCPNVKCPQKNLAQMVHFCSKDAINIDGLSEQTLQFLINKKWVANRRDIFNLYKHEKEWGMCPGFGKKSVGKILDNIDKAKDTTLARFVYALSIPLIGKSASREIADYCKGSYDVFRQTNPINYINIPGFGENMVASFKRYMYTNSEEIDLLRKVFTFKTGKPERTNELANLTFAITGNLERFKNRDELCAKIALMGGKVVTSVNAKTNYLINNNPESKSTKNVSARKHGVAIITEAEFLRMIGEEDYASK